MGIVPVVLNVGGSRENSEVDYGLVITNTTDRDSKTTALAVGPFYFKRNWKAFMT